MSDELTIPELIEIIETRAIGVDPGWQDFALEDDDWRLIVEALKAYDAEPE